MKIDRLKLIRVLQAMTPGLATKETIEQSTSFIFTGKQVVTYNDEIAIYHPIDFELEGAVMAKEFLKLLEKMKEPELEIAVTDSELLLEGAKNKAGVRFTLKTSINEIVEVLGKVKKFNKLPTSFCNAAKFCLFSVGHENTKPMLTCMHFSGNQSIACNDARITLYTFEDAELPVMNIPAYEIKSLKDYAPTEYATTPGWVHFKNAEGVVYSCRTMEGNYPKDQVLKIIASIAGDKMTLPDTLGEVLDRASVFTNENSKTIFDNRVRVTLETGKLTVRGDGVKGWFEESLRIRYKGETINFETNPEFMQDILKYSNEVVIGENALRFEGPNFVHVMRTMCVAPVEKKSAKKQQTKQQELNYEEPPFQDDDIPF